MISDITTTKWVLIASFLCVSGGFVVGFWPISLVGVGISAFGGVPIAAILFGLLLDIAYGVPTGVLHYLYVPYTIAALGAIGLRIMSMRFLLERSAQERL